MSPPRLEVVNGGGLPPRPHEGFRDAAAAMLAHPDRISAWVVVAALGDGSIVTEWGGQDSFAMLLLRAAREDVRNEVEPAGD